MTTTPIEEPAEVVCTIEGLKSMPLALTTGHELILRFAAPPGLYQFSGIVDASQFDWEKLYVELNEYHNTQQRTGPWDFALGTSKPLVPAYWVSVDGRRIGLWFFQRVSLEDLERRRFRGRMAFYLDHAGEHQLQLSPYQSMAIRWVSACLEPDPVDSLAEPPAGLLDAPGHVPVAAWRDPAYWDQQRLKLRGAHAACRQPLDDTFDWVLGVADTELQAMHLPMLIAAHKLNGRDGALEKALAVIDKTVVLSAWSNPNPEGYSHNGDINAALPLRSLAWAYHMLTDEEIQADRRQRLVAKLRYQASVFFDLALLNRDYWGGSIMQDHGRVSLPAYADAVLHLLGIIPETRLWASYAMAWVERCLRAMPRDGAIPPSSYHSLNLYLPQLMHYRQVMLALAKQDIYDRAPMRSIVDFVYGVLRDKAPLLLLACDQQGGVMPLYGQTFFKQIAVKYNDGRAAYLAGRVRALDLPTRWRFHWLSQEDTLWALLGDHPSVPPVPPQHRQAKLNWYEDSGVVHHYNPAGDVTLALRCGPWCGYHAWRHAPGPCDRMTTTVGAGHFVVFRGTTPLLATPDSVYRLHTKVRSCLLVDDRGQFGDVGYPMSIPSWRYRGEEIQSVRWDPQTNEGAIRMDLKPAYPDELGMALYTRELLLLADGRIICRDRVVLDRPHRLSWLFHGRRDIGVTLEKGLRCRFGQNPCLTMEPQSVGVELQAKVCPTSVVYGYSSEFNAFDHVRYDSTEPIAAATVDFVMHC